MGWISTDIRVGESLVDYVRRDNPTTKFSAIRRIGPRWVAFVLEGDFWGDEWFLPCPDGVTRVAGLAEFDDSFMRFIKEVSGPLNHPLFPPDMLAMLSPLADPPRGYCKQWRDRQKPH